MSDLREAIRGVYSDHDRRCHDPEVCIDEAIDIVKWRGCSGHTADAVLAVVTAHMTVSESDIVAATHAFGCERRENALRVALEAFVARKLKAETP